MARRILIVMILIACMGSTSWARKHKKHDGDDAQLTIIEISPMSLTVDAGKDVQQTYKITGQTTATLNGLPVNPGDLRAGMVTTIAMAPDNQTVLSLTAKDAPRTTKKPVVHHENVWVNLK